MTRTRKTYTPEFKLAAVQMVAEQTLPVAEVDRRLGVGEDRLHARKKAALAEGADAFPGSGYLPPLEGENRRLRAENKRPGEERDILKKAASAMKKWRPKAKSDIAKIAATGRGYAKAFFVTNQFVPDNARVQVEAELRAAHNLDVRIFDRTWILDKVFGGRHEQLAIDELRLATVPRHEVRKGPLDLQREADLATVEKRIRAAAQSDDYTLATVDDSLAAAELARDLDRPRAEVDGLLARAERLAKKLGTPHQQMECAYTKAWTAFIYYEDYDTFAMNYGDVERLVKGTRNTYEL